MMPPPTVRVAVLFVLLSLTCAAQAPFAFRIETGEEGVYSIPAESLRSLVPTDGIRSDDLVLTRDGRPVAIEVFGGADGHIDPGDAILFFAERPDRATQKTSTYVLTDRGGSVRLSKGDPDTATGETLTDAQFTVTDEVDRVFESFATVQQSIIRGPARSHWYWARLHAPGAPTKRAAPAAENEDPTTAQVPLVLEPRPLKTAPGRLRLDLVGALIDGIDQKLRIEFNGTEVGTITWNTKLEKTIEVTIPGNLLGRENMVRLIDQSPTPTYKDPGNELGGHRANSVLLDSVSVSYLAQIAGPTVSREQRVVHIAAGRDAAPRHFRIEHRHDEGYLIVDAKAKRLWRSADIAVAGDKDVTLGITSVGGARPPLLVTRLRSTQAHMPGPGADYVVVTTTDLRPVLQPLIDHREASGLKSLVVEARELYDTFTNGVYSPVAIQSFMAAAAKNWKTKPRYLLLVGDADLDCTFVNTKETIPATLVMTDYNGVTGTDALYGDTDGDGVPEIAVGRLPFRRRDDVLDFIQRVITEEKRPPAGDWRRKMTFFAGEGRFGPLVDGMIEKVVAGVLADDIPPEFNVDMTYANPNSNWYYPAPEFNQRVIDSFNAGGLVFTYIGHGSPEAFDRVSTPAGNYPILRVADVDKLNNEGRSPVMTIIACSTGHYDAPERDCIAEQMLARPGGPIAVIASSRISHPYPNALLGKSLVAPFFDRKNRVGDVLVAGKKKMLAESSGALAMIAEAQLSKQVKGATLVRDHLYLYNLLGDPAQLIPFPAAFASIEAPEKAAAGETVTVKASLPEGGDGEAVVTIEARRDRGSPPAGESAPVNAGADEIKARHLRANDVSIVRQTVPMKGGAVEASITLPPTLSKGRYAVVIAVAGSDTARCAAGAKVFKVE